MDPKVFRRCMWRTDRCMSIKTPEGSVSICRQVAPGAEIVERMYDDIISCMGLDVRIVNTEVVHDPNALPHKLVSFHISTKIAKQRVRVLKVPMVSPGYSGGRVLAEEQDKVVEHGRKTWLETQVLCQPVRIAAQVHSI